MPHIAYVILAAGNSSRFNGCKQLAQLDDNKTLIEYSIEVALKASPSQLFVVLGANRLAIKELLTVNGLTDSVTIIDHPEWRNGMGSSIGAAFQRLQHTHFDSALVLLADQIALETQQLQKMCEKWAANTHSIVAANYEEGGDSSIANTMGVPVIFPSNCFQPLSELRGNQGGKAFIKDQAHRVMPFSLHQATIDIDTQDDLAAWKSAKKTP